MPEGSRPAAAPAPEGALSRRAMLRMGGAGTTGVLATGMLAAAGARAASTAYPPPTPVDTGAVSGGRVEFPAWRGEADKPSAPPPAPLPPSQRVGFAVVGLGRLSLEEILPAFGECRKARPVALVSGTPDKLRAVAAQYGIAASACHGYDGFDRLRDDPAVQAVYIVLPNGMHREYVERAAAAGKHALCEKPMATNAADARAMVAACERAGVRLMVAYRCQYEPHHQRVQSFVREGTYGRLVGMSAVNVQTTAADATRQWRHKRALAGGGALPDIGLYCLNAARFLTGEEPVEAYATLVSPPGDPRYAEVEETVAFTLRFPSGFIANSFTSYGAREDKHQRLLFAEATVDMPNAYAYAGQRLVVGRREGRDTVEQELVLKKVNQFAAEMDHFAECILEQRRPRTPGEEGLQDQLVMEAIYRSAATGRPVPLPRAPAIDATRGPMPRQA
ncbi:MAG: Gfo/Idh/MocA family oxidoreductase [Xylophilus ampelinus]